MPKNKLGYAIEKEVRRRVRNEMLAQVHLSIYAALFAANDVASIGSKRAKDFVNAYANNMNAISDLIVTDGKDDKDIVYSKAKLDERFRQIVGEENFVEFDELAKQLCLGAYEER